jgi:hypothetical protein
MFIHYQIIPETFGYTPHMPSGKSKKNKFGLEFNGTHLLLVYAVDINLLGDSINTIKEKTETLLETSRYVGLGINAEKGKVYDYVSSSVFRTQREYKDS